MAPFSIGLIVFVIIFVMGVSFMVISMFLSKGTKRLAKKGMDITKKLMQDGNDIFDMTEQMFDNAQKRSKRKNTKKCPYCDSNIDADAVKCENCGAQQK